MEVLPGYKINTSAYHHKETHYIYKLKKTVAGVSYFNCYKPGCHARAIFKDVCTVKRPHNHKADLRDINYLKVLNSCKKRAISENTSPKIIFQEEMAKYEISIQIHFWIILLFQKNYIFKVLL